MHMTCFKIACYDYQMGGKMIRGSQMEENGHFNGIQGHKGPKRNEKATMCCQMSENHP